MRKWKAGTWFAVMGLIALGGSHSPAKAISNPIPFIQGISPVTVTPGSTSVTLTVTGANFATNAVVLWNGTSLGPPTLQSSMQIQVKIPDIDLASDTTATVTVRNPGPPPTVSNPVYFTVTSPTTFLFFSASTPGTGHGPFQPVIGDFNGDGKLDIAVSDQIDGTVAIFLGNGEGMFGNPSSTTVGSGPQGLVAGDFNNDGIQDVAVVNSASATLTIVFGSKTAPPFTTSTPTPLPSQCISPSQTAAADFNGDGNLDLAVTCQTSGHVVILLGNGDGTFGSNPMTFGAMAQPEGVAVADFNGDGKLDLAVTDATNNEVWILTGNGDGTFSAGTPYATGNFPEGVAASDFNGDGVADLAVADLTSGEISILLNNSGTFSNHTEYPSSPGAYSLVASDLNGDGLLDLAVTTDVSNTFNVLFGTGGGAFGPATSFTAGDNTTGIASADFNGDGRLDLAVTNYLDNTVSVLLQAPQLTITPASLTFPGQLLHTTSAPMLVTLTDTGSVALTLTNLSSSDPTVFLQSGSQTGGCGTPPTTLQPGGSCTSSVTFTPQNTGPAVCYNSSNNVVPCELNIGDTVPGNQQPTIPLSGTGTAPVANLTPASINFGTLLVNNKVTETATLSNSGTAALTIRGVTVAGNEYSETNNCGSSVGVGASCTISVVFTPTATGTGTGTLTVFDNSDGDPSSSQVTTLTGNAVAPVATLIPGTLTFGSQLVGTTSVGQVATLTNAGSYALTITGIKTSGDFTETTTPQNNCGGTLNIGQTCAITVTFTPTASGTRTGSLTVTDNSNGATGSNQTVTLTGTGVAPVASLAPGSLSYSSQAVGTTSPAQTVTLSNTGTATLIVTSISASNDFAVASNTCAGSLTMSSSCTIMVTFSPAANGARSGTLTVTDNSNGVANSTQTASLSGTGAAPEASFAPASLTFASQGVGTSSAAQTVTLTNSGSQALTINSITVSGDFTETTTCGSSLAAGANCTISVTFKPTAAGTRSGTLSVTDNSNNATGITQTLSLTGTGTVPTASLSPATLPAFAGQAVGTSSAVQTITLSNTGAAALSVTSIATGGANGSEFTATNTCNGSVAARASCSISVTFKPVAAGARAATLTVTDNSNGVAGSTQTVSLSGTGIAPVIQLSAAALTFTSQNVGTTGSVQSLTITNSGSASLTLTSITTSGDFSQTSACGSALSPGATCTVTVTFKPSAPGSRTGALLLSDNAAPGSQSVSLTGTGVGAEATLSPPGLTFAGDLLGATGAAQTVKLTNAGNAALTVSNIAASGDFSETNTCPASLAAGANCTVTVTFKPAAAGSRSGTLTFTNSAAGSPQSVSLTGTGQDFSLTATSTSASVSPGQTVTYSVSLAPLDGLDQAVSLSCNGAPSESSCSVTPASVTGATTFKVTVTTTAPSALVPPSGPTPPGSHGRGEWLLLSLFALAGMSGLARARCRSVPARRRIVLGTVGLLAILAFGMAACGGGSSTVTSSNPGTAPGTYSLTVTGTATSGSASVGHNLTLTLKVQ